MKLIRRFVIAAALTVMQLSAIAQPKSVEEQLLIKPYVQLGQNASRKGNELVIMWHASDNDASWLLETKSDTADKWSSFPVDTVRVETRSIDPYRILSSTLNKLAAGEKYQYRVKRNGNVVFESFLTTPKPAGAPFRFVVFGDCGQGTPEQKMIANQVYLNSPDLALIPGDIVYNTGLASEYRVKHFPVYNADRSGPEVGAPLIRSTLFVAAPGNHDILHRAFKKTPDALAYYYYWSQPLNGPLGISGAKNTPTLDETDSESDRSAFVSASGRTYPRMANFSFEFGDAHYLILDSNPYMDWSDSALRTWVEKDLSQSTSRWKFVMYHHPGFNSSAKHANDQWMRLLSPVFEKCGVDIVFQGHVHNYQRTFPLTFLPEPGDNGNLRAENGSVKGKFTFDKRFNGTTQTKPNGVMYVISGAGGAELYNSELTTQPDAWQPFTANYIADTHSFTVIDLDGGYLQLRQISKDGKELDRITITK